MNSLKNKALISIFFLLGGSFLFPTFVQAGTCVCYFGTLFGTDSCSPHSTQTDPQCYQLCFDANQNLYRDHEHSDDDADADLLLECQEAASAAAQARADEEQAGKNNLQNVAALETLTPELNVPIPGLVFSPVSVAGDVVRTGYIGDYISGLYAYLITAATVIAIVMFMIAGLQYSFGAVSQPQLASAKKRMVNALTGLILLLGSVIILEQVNPQLVSPKPIGLTTISPHDVIANSANEPSPSKTPPPPYSCKGGNKPSEYQGLGIMNTTLDNYGCGQRDLKKVKFIVLHEGSWGGDTINTLEGRGLSTHYVIRQSGEIVQTMDIRKNAYHAGAINGVSVGIDLELPKNCRCGTWGSCVKSASNCTYPQAQYAAIRDVISLVSSKTGVTLDDDHIVGHCNIGGHGDPRNFDWSQLSLSTEAHRKEPKSGNCTRVDWEKMVAGK